MAECKACQRPFENSIYAALELGSSGPGRALAASVGFCSESCMIEYQICLLELIAERIERLESRQLVEDAPRD